jgi:hypothetical protein
MKKSTRNLVVILLLIVAGGYIAGTQFTENRHLSLFSIIPDCSVDSNCIPGQKCVSGYCKAGCTPGEAICPSGEGNLCQPSGQCLCGNNNDCPVGRGQVCRGGYCSDPLCTSDSQCSVPLIYTVPPYVRTDLIAKCVSGECVATTGATDNVSVALIAPSGGVFTAGSVVELSWVVTGVEQTLYTEPVVWVGGHSVNGVSCINETPVQGLFYQVNNNTLFACDILLNESIFTQGSFVIWSAVGAIGENVSGVMDWTSLSQDNAAMNFTIYTPPSGGGGGGGGPSCLYPNTIVNGVCTAPNQPPTTKIVTEKVYVQGNQTVVTLQSEKTLIEKYFGSEATKWFGLPIGWAILALLIVGFILWRYSKRRKGHKRGR